MVIPSSRAVEARAEFHFQYPKIKIGISSNGDKGWHLVATVHNEEEASYFPNEILEVPIQIKIQSVIK